MVGPRNNMVDCWFLALVKCYLHTNISEGLLVHILGISLYFYVLLRIVKSVFHSFIVNKFISLVIFRKSTRIFIIHLLSIVEYNVRCVSIYIFTVVFLNKKNIGYFLLYTLLSASTAHVILLFLTPWVHAGCHSS